MRYERQTVRIYLNVH